MTKFKIGDKVTWSDRTYAREVEERNPDEILTVSGFDSDYSQYVHFQEFPAGAYESRFELVEDLQMSNESGYLVQKISVENDVVSSGVSDNQPKAQDNSWYENGELPPVGANIEYKLGAGPWYEATVKYVLDVLDGDEDEIVIACPHLGFEQLLTLNKHTKIRPAVSPADIAKQERAAYCDRIYAVLCKAERKDNRSDMAEALYDAGLRFVEEE